MKGLTKSTIYSFPQSLAGKMSFINIINNRIPMRRLECRVFHHRRIGGEYHERIRLFPTYPIYGGFKT